MRCAGRVGRCQGSQAFMLLARLSDVKLWQARTVAPQPHTCHSRMHGDLSSSSSSSRGRVRARMHGPGSPLERVERRPTLRAHPTRSGCRAVALARHHQDGASQRATPTLTPALASFSTRRTDPNPNPNQLFNVLRRPYASSHTGH
eukprot:scaffold133312_cov64-Phaeocystis_antarctica.AAC.8